MSPRGRAAETVCPVCRGLVGLINKSFANHRTHQRRADVPQVARHKPIPGGPWCTGAGLAVEPAAVFEVAR